MQIIKHNPANLFPQYRGYTHAVEIRGDSRLLMIKAWNSTIWFHCAPISPTPQTTRPTCACASSIWATMKHPQP